MKRIIATTILAVFALFLLLLLTTFWCCPNGVEQARAEERARIERITSSVEYLIVRAKVEAAR